MSEIGVWFNIALLALLAGCCYSDITRRVIPNYFCAAILLLGIADGLIGSRSGWGYGLLGGLVLFVCTLALHEKRVLGGGDIKLLAVLAVWLTPIELGRFVLATALAGGLVGLFYLLLGLLRRLRDKEAPVLGSVPYALAIVGGFGIMRPDYFLLW